VFPSTFINALVLLDIHGAQAQWLLNTSTTPYFQDITIAPDLWVSNYGPKNPDCLYYNMPFFDMKLVRMLGVQMEYQAGSTNADIAISDVHFLGRDGQENCAVWTCQ
jgi:hypothetical protein